ncbi:MAG: protein TolR [Proteobacteria bacterium]|nr:protein TolR [Pseudomonadota bacterium]MBU4469949.1 protein TolR [Pseudomonadota bacterium]MCG2753711.1 protein TolR [Desulfobacteraceae bacterium]
MMTSGDKDGLMSEINVTPFVDVMLVLLIIFMVTAPMMTQGINIDLPQANSDPLESENEQLLVSINKDNQVYINDIAVSVEIIKEKLESILVNQKNREVYLKADKGVPYGAVMRVMSEIKNAGVEKLGMVTMPEESEPTSDRQK